MNTQKGFTLIELVVVMVILGILAAFAIPRFYDFRAQSRVAVLQGIGAAMLSAAYVAHGAQMVEERAPDESVFIEDQNIFMVNGFPDVRAADSDGGGIQALVQTDVATQDDNGFGYDATCKVTYTPAPANGAPSITIPDVTDCQN